MNDATLGVIFAGCFTLVTGIVTAAVALRSSNATTRVAEKRLEAEVAKDDLLEWQKLCEKYEKESEKHGEDAERFRQKWKDEQKRADELEEIVRDLRQKLHAYEDTPKPGTLTVTGSFIEMDDTPHIQRVGSA